jgi:hypothetical protein
VFEWHARFRASQTSIEEDQHKGRPISCATPDTVAKLQQILATSAAQFLGYIENSISYLMEDRLYYGSVWLKIRIA